MIGATWLHFDCCFTELAL